MAMSPPLFIACFVCFLIFVILLYLFTQFDLEYKQRNQQDLHYMIMFIFLPASIGMNARFQPKLSSIRLIYALILLVMVSFWQIIFFLDVRFIKTPIQRHQISTVHEIVQEDFHLAGSLELRELISFDQRVNIRINESLSSFDLIQTLSSTKNPKWIRSLFARASIVVWIV